MTSILRTCSLIALLSLIAFPALADNGLRGLGDALEMLFIFVVWLIGSAALLTIGLIAFAKKRPAGAFLVYFGFASLFIMYLRYFFRFWENWGKVIFDDTLDSSSKDDALGYFRIFILAGVLLLGGLVTFGVWHWRSVKRTGAPKL